MGNGAGGRGNGPGVLVTDRDDYSDFKLRAVAFNSDDKDKQIIIRRSSTETTTDGYCINVGGTENGDGKSIPIGSISKKNNHRNGTRIEWNVIATAISTPVGTWHTLEVVATGNKIATYVNGQKAAEYTDRGSPTFTSGEIILVCRSDSSIQYKEISIEELSNGLGMMSMPMGSIISMMGGEPAGGTGGVLSDASEDSARALMGTPPVPPAARIMDSLSLGSKWEGSWTFQDPGFAGKEANYSVTITERDGDGFRGKGVLSMPEREIEVALEGTVEGDRIEYIETGEKAYKFHINGEMHKNSIALRFQGTGRGGEPRFGTGEMSMQ